MAKEIGTRTADALGNPHAVSKAQRIRTTLYLNERNYKRFKKLCKARGKTTSEVLDMMVADALDTFE